MSDWETLHTQNRQKLRYPSEHVIRFLSRLHHVGVALDIGCGHGRHVSLLQDFTDYAEACDSSQAAADWCTAATGIHADVGDMTDLPYAADNFDTAIAYGVFYYGTTTDHRDAAAELHRVLRPGGHALIKTRTSRDWRITNPKILHNPQEPEHGMTMNFLPATAIPDVYAAFTSVQYELTETTTHQRTRTNSDWLITVTK